MMLNASSKFGINGTVEMINDFKRPTGQLRLIQLAPPIQMFLESCDRLTSDNDITASSAFGLDGTVEINTPDVDPSSQVLELPNVLVDASQLVRPGCSLDERSLY